MSAQKALQGSKMRELPGGTEEYHVSSENWSLICPPSKSIVSFTKLAALIFDCLRPSLKNRVTDQDLTYDSERPCEDSDLCGQGGCPFYGLCLRDPEIGFYECHCQGCTPEDEDPVCGESFSLSVFFVKCLQFKHETLSWTPLYLYL